MRKVLFAILLMIATISASAQIGFPWGAEKWMAKADFKKTMAANSNSVFIDDGGDVLTYKDGHIGGENIKYAYAYFFENQLYKLVIMLSPVNKNSVLPQYNSLKKIYSKKYGTPFEDVERYAYPYQKGDGYEASAISSGDADIMCLWKGSDGTIFMAIDSKGYSAIIYEDERFSRIVNKQREQKVLNDI